MWEEIWWGIERELTQCEYSKCSCRYFSRSSFSSCVLSFGPHGLDASRNLILKYVQDDTREFWRIRDCVKHLRDVFSKQQWLEFVSVKSPQLLTSS